MTWQYDLATESSGMPCLFALSSKPLVHRIHVLVKQHRRIRFQGGSSPDACIHTPEADWLKSIPPMQSIAPITVHAGMPSGNPFTVALTDCSNRGVELISRS